MPVVNYLKNKQKNIQSKFHQITKRFEVKSDLMHRKLTSRFHREKAETDLIRSQINHLITESIKSKIQSKRFIHVFSKTSTKKNDRLYPDIIDWFQGRFSGQTIRIVIRKGIIIEKVFLTPKGNEILVKRNALRLRFRSMPIMQIRLRLRLRSMSNIQRQLGSISIKRV